MKAIAALLMLAPAAALAVYLNPEGSGQALIFPYYAVQSANGTPFNTYISIRNDGRDSKALRVRLREARNGRSVASINVFLSPNDMWTAALVPGPTSNDPPRLITSDTSCTDPQIPAAGLTLDLASFTGANLDGSGSDPARLREGFAEVLEMGTLGSPAAISAAQRRACIGLRATVPVAAPTGNLSGTVTLINVANGTDFAVNATALAQLASKPFFRAPEDPYPDFNASEIDPWSTAVVGDSLLRSVWSRPVDAVSASLMAANVTGEYVLDPATHSASEWVVTLPTRQFYSNPNTTNGTPPFTAIRPWSAACSSVESFNVGYYDREGLAPPQIFDDLPPPRGFPISTCSSTFVVGMRTAEQAANADGSSRVFGSRLRDARIDPALHSGFVNGSFRLTPTGPNAAVAGLQSTSASTRTSLSTGVVATQPNTFNGLPLVGFWVRTFENGTLACDAGRCQGNYGAAFPFTRSLTYELPR